MIQRLREWFAGLPRQDKAAWVSAAILVLIGAYALALATNLLVALVHRRALVASRVEGGCGVSARGGDDHRLSLRHRARAPRRRRSIRCRPICPPMKRFEASTHTSRWGSRRAEACAGRGPTRRTRARQGAGAPTDDRPPISRPGLDAALILLVDGTAPVVDKPEELEELDGTRGEEERWRRIARVATRTDIPAFALLQTRSHARLDRWKEFTPGGVAVSLQGLSSPSVTDAGVRLAIAAPESQSDYALAVQFRPILFFDSKEPVPRPLRIETLFGENRVHLCHDERLAGTECDEPAITDPAKLVNGNTHLRLSLREPEELQKLARDELRPGRGQRRLDPAAGVQRAWHPCELPGSMPRGLLAEPGRAPVRPPKAPGQQRRYGQPGAYTKDGG